MALTRKTARVEYWYKYTHGAWWLPYPDRRYAINVLDMNEKWNHETVRTCQSCNKVYEQETRSKKKYVVTYYSQLTKSGFRYRDCAVCDDTKAVAFTETV